MVRVHEVAVPLPAQSPDQPAMTEPEAGDAVRVTVAPAGNCGVPQVTVTPFAEGQTGQLPGRLLVSEPWPYNVPKNWVTIVWLVFVAVKKKKGREVGL